MTIIRVAGDLLTFRDDADKLFIAPHLVRAEFAPKSAADLDESKQLKNQENPEEAPKASSRTPQGSENRGG